MNAILDKLVGLGRNDWDTAVDWASVSVLDSDNAEREAANMVQRYAEFAGYLYERSRGHDHISALKSASALLKSVRKAMGYTFP